jgi:hypothetical protein
MADQENNLEPSNVEVRRQRQPTNDPEIQRAYSDVVDAAELMTIDLVSCNFTQKDEYLVALQQAAESGKPVEFTYGLDGREIEIDEEQGWAHGLFTWKLSVKAKSKKPLKIDAQFRIVYKNLAGLDPQAITHFINHVGKFASFPYFRSLVSQLSWFGNAQLPILPVLRDD